LIADRRERRFDRGQGGIELSPEGQTINSQRGHEDGGALKRHDGSVSGRSREP